MDSVYDLITYGNLLVIKTSLLERRDICFHSVGDWGEILSNTVTESFIDVIPGLNFSREFIDESRKGREDGLTL